MFKDKEDKEGHSLILNLKKFLLFAGLTIVIVI